MTLAVRIVLLASLGALSLPAGATDQGQYANVPSDVRAWFKNVRSPNGVPCCDIADGHRIDWDMRDDGYWVRIDGEWVPVPGEAVVKNAGNPVGEAVVWYTKFNGKPFIRCFVPGGGV
jgi:hypothetical protein